MKLYTKNIEKSLKNAEKNRFFQRLEKIYNLIPIGNCSGCASCCMESVNTFYIEFLNIYRYLEQNKNLKNKLFPKILNFYFLELVKKMPCPFLTDEKKCSIYEVRPLTCRLFGYWEKKEYENNYKKVLRENRSNYKYFKEVYNIILPNETVNYKIDYCEDFISYRKILKSERQSMIDNLFTIESNFFMKGLISEDFLNTGLVSWFVYTIYDIDKAGDLRINIMKEYLDCGESALLFKVLKNY
jgi:Fe-S-cluster containining protein